jgi:uncharacterized protein (TIGR00255 family)
MIKSMTGFSSITYEDEQGVVGVTIRAVNHRYLDLQLRAPASMSERESALRAAVQRRVSRGRVELSVSLQPRQQTALQVELNATFLGALQAALTRARNEGLIDGHLTPGDLLRLPQALSIRERPAGDEGGAVWGPAAEGVLARAIDALDEMRSREGAALRVDLSARKSALGGLIEAIAGAADHGRAQIEVRLLERAREMSASLPIDQAALAQEVVRVAQRSDIAEEVTRFRAHLDHWDVLADADEPCGRKLDFLLQEMNREINTIGSKADGVPVSELIIQAKAELERMREQVQNVE